MGEFVRGGNRHREAGYKFERGTSWDVVTMPFINKIPLRRKPAKVSSILSDKGCAMLGWCPVTPAQVHLRKVRVLTQIQVSSREHVLPPRRLWLFSRTL